MAEKEMRPFIGTSMVVEKNGLILIGLRVSGEWCFPGGHVEYGEGLRDAAIRETKEESGIEVNDISVLTITEDFNPPHHYITVHFRARWKSGTPRPEKDKFIQWRWVKWGEWPDPLFQPTKHYIEREWI